MLIWENFLLALVGIKSNKMRSLLTMLGIIIGISAVIAIVSIGNSLSKSLENDMKSWGMQNLSVNVAYRSVENEEGMYEDPNPTDMLTLKQLLEFREAFLDKVEAISFSKSGSSDGVRVGRSEVSVTVEGTNEGYSVIKKIKLNKGRYINVGDIERGANIIVIPLSMAEKINASGDVIGKELKLTINEQMFAFTIVGIYDDKEKAGEGFMGYQDTPTVYIPVSVMGEINNDMNYNYFDVMPKTSVDSNVLTSEITDYFDEIYKANKKWHCEVYNAQKDMDDLMGSMDKIKFAIAVIAGISLLVGGIGVMNIMLVSVTERTREIGVRKALGAKRGFIKTQFIVEAMIICAIGGIIGVILGLSISVVVAMVMKNPVVISIPTIIISVLFSMSIGVFFGYYPANKASKLDPIEALRYE